MTSAVSLDEGGSRLRFGVVSVVGNYREHNEDNFAVPGGRGIPSGADGNSAPAPAMPTGLFIVADGMGGQQAGEEASKMAVEIIPKALSGRLRAEDDPKATIGAIRDAVAEANQEILAQSSLGNEFANMGTTVVLALFQNGRAYVAGIGDSRAYRLHEAEFEPLTTDHSMAQALADAGTISPEEMETHKFKHVLYLYLGSRDARGGPDHVRVVDARPGDKFLLASDGLTGVVKDEQLAELLRAHDDPQDAAQALVDLALENISKDNVTCVVIHVI